jgi:hypothetical protein
MVEMITLEEEQRVMWEKILILGLGCPDYRPLGIDKVK